MIKKFVDEHLVKTNNEADFVVRADLDQSFSKLHPEIQQGRKIKVTKSLFLERMLQLLGEENFRQSKMGRKDAFVKWKTRSSAVAGSHE